MNKYFYPIYKNNSNIVNNGIKNKEKVNKFKKFKLRNFFKLYIFIFISYISNVKENSEIQTKSYIEFNVKGPGNKTIFYISEGNNMCKNMIPPDEMQINDGEPILNPEKVQYLNKEENNVKLIWINKKINTLHCLFNECPDIITADFSHFNSTFVDSLNDLFDDCHSLISINFNNFDSSNVIDMHLMFYNCFLLKSIDLSNFDTSKVQEMFNMFY